MGYWRTIVIEGKPKYWDKPNARWKLSPPEDESLLEVIASHADYEEINADTDTEELTASQAAALAVLWGNPPWIYPTASELYGIGYCSIPDLRARGITEEQATDEELRQAIQVATLYVDSYCRRNFWRRQETYLMDGTGSSIMFLHDRPVISISRITVDETDLDPSEFRVYRDEGYIRLDVDEEYDLYMDTIFTLGVQNVQVEGQFGYETIPPDVRQACLVLAVDALRELKAGVDLDTSTSSSTRNAIGLKSAKIEDISVSFEYPRSVSSGEKGLNTTGNTEADSLLRKYRRDMEAFVV